MPTLSKGAYLQHGTYRIELVLGQGGFGITYLATDLNLQRKVAIKEFFPSDFCNRDEMSSYVILGTSHSAKLVNRLKLKFLKEARNIAKFDHPNIIRIYAAFEENNTAYYVMEYIEGESLSSMVKKHGPLSEGRAIGYIKKIGNALKYVHARKMNHLDVKPANIMVRRSDDTPILIDFGLSKQYDSDGKQTSTTLPGVSHGFAPLEQYNEGGVKDFTPQSDIYSLAATLYFLLSGVIPPQATRLVEELLVFPDSIPAHLLPPITKAMSSTRLDRHETVAEFIEEFGIETDTEEKSAPQPKSKVKWYITGGCLLFLSVVVFLYVISRNNYVISRNNPTGSGEYRTTKADSSVDVVRTDSTTTVIPPKDSIPVLPETVSDMYYKSSLGACSYTGEVDSERKPHGRGKAEWESGLGVSYNGMWVHGQMEGDCEYLSRGGYRFIGKFKKGHYFEGKLISPDKSYYEGTFNSNGNKWTGTEYDPSGKKIDEWKNGK